MKYSQRYVDVLARKVDNLLNKIAEDQKDKEWLKERVKLLTDQNTVFSAEIARLHEEGATNKTRFEFSFDQTKKLEARCDAQAAQTARDENLIHVLIAYIREGSP